MPSKNAEGNWVWPKADGDERLCTMPGGGGAFECPSDQTCGHPFQFLDKPVSLDADGTINDELISYSIPTFDNMIVGLLTIFQMITLEGWSGIMYNLSDASQSWLAILFCFLIVIVGSMFLLNVVLAVIMDAFEDVDKNSKAAENKKRKEYKEMLEHYKIHDADLENLFTNSSHKSSEGNRMSGRNTPLNVIDNNDTL